jgi:hypothetical protein
VEGDVHRRLYVGDPAGHRRRDHEPVVVREERVLGTDGDEIAAGRGPRQFEGGCCRAGSVLRELHHLGAGDRGREPFRTFELDPRRPAEVRTGVEHLPYGLDDLGVGVAERDRAQPRPVLDELVPVDVPNPATPPVGKHRRRLLGVLVGAFRIRVAAARNERTQAGAELDGAREVDGHGRSAAPPSPHHRREDRGPHGTASRESRAEVDPSTISLPFPRSDGTVDGSRRRRAASSLAPFFRYGSGSG